MKIHSQARTASSSLIARRRQSIWPALVVTLQSIGPPAHAQAEPAEAAAADEAGALSASMTEVQVTGSRIARDGYSAPTPLTVIGEDDIKEAAPANVADFVNELPSVMGSTTPGSSGGSVSSGGAGLNAINLRNLDATRTLVLLDGQRSVASAVTGIVDVNTFPQALIKRVEIVTGGASAAYGSDAVSGVVNFILDKEFVGLKTSLEYGETTYGDNAGHRATVSAGRSFANGRGHALFSGEHVDRDGVFETNRPWNTSGWFMINNPAYTPTNGQPERLVTAHAGLSNATPGGIITNTELRGTYFGHGGSVNQFNYGATKDPWMVGGDWELVQITDTRALEPSDKREGLFGRISYALTDNFEVFAQASWNKHDSLGYYAPQTNQGNIVIQTDNAFLPESVRARAEALGITQFNMGSTNADLPITKSYEERATTRYVVGARGGFDLLGKPWKWDTYYQKGITHTLEMARDITNNARLAQAQDAVIDPSTGNIVCRSTLTNPDDGCIPFNRMGIGVNSPEAVAWLLGDPYRNQRFGQDAAAVNVTTSAFDNWAGPVSLAAGIEYRKEEVSGFVPTEFQSGWFLGNFLPNFGEYNVKELYVESVLPLMSRLDLNAAVRATDYSTSGYVTTWKAGLTYSPVDSITLRATRSRDIRAPNLAELFQSGTARTNYVIDPFNGNTSTQFLERVTGNPDLDPEEADTIGVGLVFRPSFMSGFGASIDYYEIEIAGAIGSVQAQTIVDRCYEGNAAYCAAITRGTSPGGTSVITEIRQSPFNYAQQRARGIDFEASYGFALSDLMDGWAGNVTLRALATNYLENRLDNGIDPPTDTVGQNAGSNATGGGPPKWQYRLSAGYKLRSLAFNLAARGISAGVYSNDYIECASDCPPSTVTHRTVNNNHIAGALYLDTSLIYGFDILGSAGEAFFSVDNLTNREPAIVAGGPDGSVYSNVRTNRTLYDVLGRRFRIGLRFEW